MVVRARMRRLYVDAVGHTRNSVPTRYVDDGSTMMAPWLNNQNQGRMMLLMIAGIMTVGVSFAVTLAILLQAFGVR